MGKRKLKLRLRRPNFTRKGILTAAVLIFTIAAAYFAFSESYVRIWESLQDIGSSFQYLFVRLVKGKERAAELSVSVNDPSSIPLSFFLPKDWGSFKECMRSYWGFLISLENFLNYVFSVLDVVYYVLMCMMILLLPAALLLTLIDRTVLKKKNRKTGERTSMLELYDDLLVKRWTPIKTFFVEWYQGFRTNKRVWTTFVFIWILSFNFATLLLEFFAFYVYFASSMNILQIYMQLYKLFFDVALFLKLTPWPVTLCLFLAVFNWWRLRHGMKILRAMEAFNKAFVRGMSKVILMTGLMGAGKTKTMTDVLLTKEVIYREDARSLMFRCEDRFPFFSWAKLDQELREAKEQHVIFNLASCVEWILLRSDLFFENGSKKEHVWGYDFERYGSTYNDGLRLRNLWEVLDDYTRAWFIYNVRGSLTFANYSIRLDQKLIDYGNMVDWDLDFFARDPMLQDQESYRARILDQDMLRMGRKMDPKNPHIGMYEFGSVAISELGKERPNMMETKELKKKDEDVNQKNDLFSYSPKFIRHPSTIDGICFGFWAGDEQRPASIPADLREILYVHNIVESDASKERRCTLPFSEFGDVFDELFMRFFNRIRKPARVNRGDDFLLFYVARQLMDWLHNRHVRRRNVYGYTVSTIDVSLGSKDAEVKQHRYYLMDKKIFSNRYSTDCYAEYFRVAALRSGKGIEDVDSYQRDWASIDELRAQNSYLVRDIDEKIAGNKKDSE